MTDATPERSTPISLEEALDLLPAGEHIHNFMLSLCLMGCDSDRDWTEALLRDAKALFLSRLPRHVALGHPILVEAADGRGYLIAADMDKVRAREAQASAG